MSQTETSAPRASGQLPSAVPGGSGRGVVATWWFTFVSMALFALFLAFITASQLAYFHHEADSPRSWQLTVTSALVLVSGAAQALASWQIRHGMGTGWPRAWALVLLLLPAGVVWVATLWMPGGALHGGVPLWVSANVLAVLVYGSARTLTLAVGAVLMLGHWLLGQYLMGSGVPDGEYAAQVSGMIFFITFVPVIYLFSGWWWNVVVQLDAARRDAAQLAVVRERLRFASDLHDIQGHHLQVIALKAELAERLLGAGQAEAAGANIHEVRTLARTALEETRGLVRNLREISLEEEIANARDVLEASGATVTLKGASVLDPTARRLLGLAVREGATNILRHAPEATEVTIVLSSTAEGARLVVGNDAVSPVGPAGDGLGNGAVAGTGASQPSGPASGLAGLDRRFADAGGSVSGRRESGTFVLEAWVPAAPTAPAGPGPGTHPGMDRELRRQGA